MQGRIRQISSNHLDTKRAIKFWKHLKLSNPQSYHYKALQYQEMSKESKPFLQLIQSFSPDASLTSTDALNHNIRTNQITAQIKQSYITHWQTRQQSKMQCYLSLKREYSMAEYLFTVSDKKLRSTLTRYRLSGQADDRDGQTQTNMAAPGAEIVFTV